jgi:autotransporter passenger strand-loop-strand repeat protein
VFKGGAAFVRSGGTISAMVVSGVDVISSGGVESGATISKGGIEKVLSAGFASSSTVESGGTQIVLSAGTASL